MQCSSTPVTISWRKRHGLRGSGTPASSRIGTSANAVSAKRRHRNTNGSALSMLYFAAMKPVLQMSTKHGGASRISQARSGIVSPGARFGPSRQEPISSSSTSKISASKGPIVPPAPRSP